MPENLERIGFYLAAIVHLVVVIWWASATNSAVERQDQMIRALNPQVAQLSERVIRIEEKTGSLEMQLKSVKDNASRTRTVLERIERLLNENRVQ